MNGKKARNLRKFAERNTPEKNIQTEYDIGSPPSYREIGGVRMKMAGVPTKIKEGCCRKYYKALKREYIHGQ